MAAAPNQPEDAGETEVAVDDGEERSPKGKRAKFSSNCVAIGQNIGGEEENKATKVSKNGILLEEDDTSPAAQKDKWRAYFTDSEMTNAYNQIAKGLDPTELEDVDDSDSNPSEDNLDPAELQDLLSQILPQNSSSVSPPAPTKEIIPRPLPRPPPISPEEPIAHTKKPEQSAPRFEAIAPKRVALPWDSGTCPSLIITSKNACKAASLIPSGAGDEPHTLYSTYAKNGMPEDLKACSAGDKRLSQRLGKIRREIKKKGAGEGTRLYRSVGSGVRQKLAPISDAFTMPVQSFLSQQQSRKAVPNGAGFFSQQEIVGASANMRMVMGNAPQINISIKNVNINSGPEQLQDASPRRHMSMRSDLQQVGPVLAGMLSTQHDRVFMPPNRFLMKSVERHRATFDHQLNELLWSGFIPMNISDATLRGQKPKGNVSFGPESLFQPLSMHGSAKMPHRAENRVSRYTNK